MVVLGIDESNNLMRFAAFWALGSVYHARFELHVRRHRHRRDCDASFRTFAFFLAAYIYCDFATMDPFDTTAGVQRWFFLLFFA